MHFIRDARSRDLAALSQRPPEGCADMSIHFCTRCTAWPSAMLQVLNRWLQCQLAVSVCSVADQFLQWLPPAPVLQRGCMMGWSLLTGVPCTGSDTLAIFSRGGWTSSGTLPGDCRSLFTSFTCPRFFFHEYGRRVGMVPRSSLKGGKNSLMVEKRTRTPNTTQTKQPKAHRPSLHHHEVFPLC